MTNLLKSIYYNLSRKIRDLKDDKLSCDEHKYDSSHLPFIGSVKLSREEKIQVYERWHGAVPCRLSRGHNFFAGMKGLGDFNPNYLPSSYFYPYVERILNPTYFNHKLFHKSLIELVYGSGIKHPHSVLRSYGGVLLNHDYKPVSIQEACSLIHHSDTPLLFKPATDTIQGNGIRYYQKGKISELERLIRTSEIFATQVDFVIQCPVEQSIETIIFNPTSLNCMRITTLNLNGKVSVCSRALKCGPKDSVVDNIGSGKRGVIVGINNDGTLCEKGFYGNGEIATQHNGTIFSGKNIPHFGLVEDAAIKLHSNFDSCKIIGWDIALDSDNQPVLIEGNVVYPGISMEQMCSGPIFGDRTDEVIDYLKHNK